MNHPSTVDLAKKLNKAIRKERWDAAFALYAELAVADPDEPRWPNREGDLHRRLGHDRRAVSCYERAVDRYAKQGFLARAAAMAKVLLSIDPTRIDVLARVDPTRARELMELKRRAATVGSGRASLVDAPMLSRQDAPCGETRFSSVAPEASYDLALSDVEIVGRQKAPPAIGSPDATLSRDDDAMLSDDIVFLDDDAAPSPEELAALPGSPLFASVPAAALQQLLESAGLVEAAAGETFIHFGEPADALYLITEGRAEVRVPNRDGAPILLGEGDVVGESCLLDDVTRRADVVAQSSLRALSLPKTTLDELVAKHTDVGEVLTELLGRRLLSNLLATSELFAAFDPESKRALSRLFEVRRAEEGTSLLTRGKRSDGLYVLLAGRLSAVTENEERSLGPGEVVGERSLLDHAPSEFDCAAKTDVLLLRLPRTRFLELCASYPPVLASLAELAERKGAVGAASVV